MVQVLTFSEGRVSVALIPDRLRSLLADDLETQKKKVAVIADYLPPQGTTSNNDEISDRLTLLSLPKHAGREEFLVRFQRGRAVWMVLVYGAENFFDFDRRYIQSFLPSMRICHPAAELQSVHLPSLN
ncbi:MAG: hypothetical protein ACO329_00570 [Steroidobacteraceae bacterium]|jgi:hypothetical protein